jgi:hypothetical protein
MKKEAARAVFFGYWEVFAFHVPVAGRHDQSAFWEFSSKRRNLEASESLYQEGRKAVDLAVSQVMVEVAKTQASDKLFSQVMLGLSSIVNARAFSEAESDPRFSKKRLVEAASLGLTLGVLDPDRRGEQEPVALGVHHDAGAEIRKQLRSVNEEPSQPDAMGFLLQAIFQVGFFLSRGDRLVK